MGHKHIHTKLIFPPGMCAGSLKLYRQQAFFFFPSAGCLKYLQLSQGRLRVSSWPECAFQMDVCHRMIDIPLVMASTNHTPAIVVQQPGDKKHGNTPTCEAIRLSLQPMGFKSSVLP